MSLLRSATPGKAGTGRRFIPKSGTTPVVLPFVQADHPTDLLNGDPALFEPDNRIRNMPGIRGDKTIHVQVAAVVYIGRQLRAGDEQQIRQRQDAALF